jgi:predicted dienelactone hydrolase
MSSLIAAGGMMILAGGAFFMFATSSAPLPPPSGQYAVASRPLDLPAESNAVATPIVEIWYPTGKTADRETATPSPPPVAGAPLPVLVYLPSWGGTAVDDVFLIRDLVSHGFVVASLRYPSEQEVTEGAAKGVTLRTEAPGDMSFSSEQAFEDTWALGSKKVRARAQNVVAVLDRLARLNEEQPSGFAHRLDLDRIGVWGFSLGGAAAAQAAWLDHRIKAAVNLDGWHFADAATEGVPCPYLYISDATPLPGPAELTASDPEVRYTAILDTQDYDHMIAGMKRHGGFYLKVDGTTHVNFSDDAIRRRFRRLSGAGSLDARRALVITGDYLQGFFDTYLLGHASPLLEHDSPAYPEAHLQIIGSSNARS